ncbi:Hydroxyacylglutathione hydrolase [Desulfuromonas sp. DDH964]|uniref:MBL fold metallo-hydrolase n=1 Tax=Desulfuromonas sp. DDH964 TaxID=1823759 RepID=UPI00078D77F0|nr:MBL fold metallo-hydrolase [Desulfuromonas sp. DDH964]AMV71614.1 Hydroxyacylglutathione hydrolase [Desulfuromonas sp. DDH964]
MKLDRLHCIDLDQPTLEGFRHFISAWLYQGEETTLLVDPGPLSTIPHLLAELRRLGVSCLDHILLTHIHIDHAGGTGELLKVYPEARVLCHPDGVRHLVDPEKLWQGSCQVLGALAEVYGPIVPVPADRIGFDAAPAPGLSAHLTPGHAAHHCCYLLDDLLFAGEVAGVRAEIPGAIYMRPATPPRFLPEVADDSLARMLELRPKRMVFAHYGLVDKAMQHLKIARDQLVLWLQGVAATAAFPGDYREEAFFAWLLEHDPVYRRIDELPGDIQARERIFLGNTLKGMSEYLEGAGR